MNYDIGILIVLVLLSLIFYLSIKKIRDTYVKAVFWIQITFIGGIIVLKSQDLLYELIGYAVIAISLVMSIMAAAGSDIKNK